MVQTLSPRTNLPERFDRIVQSWDTANKVTELSDFSVCTTWCSATIWMGRSLRSGWAIPAVAARKRSSRGDENEGAIPVEDGRSSWRDDHDEPLIRPACRRNVTSTGLLDGFLATTAVDVHSEDHGVVHDAIDDGERHA